MRSLSLVALGLVAGSPLVHANPNGGYLKSVYSGSMTVARSSTFDDSRFYSLWVSIMQHLPTVTVTTSVTTTVTTTTTTTGDELDQIITILPHPPITHLEVTKTDSVYSTVTKSVSSCSSACPSMAVVPVIPKTTTSSAKMSSSAEPSKNGTMPTSTQMGEPTMSSTTSRRLGPSSTPPPLNGPINGVSTTAAPVMGAVAVAIAGWVLMV